MWPQPEADRLKMRQASRGPRSRPRLEPKEPIRPISIAFPQCPYNLNGGPHSSETRKDILGREVMLCFAETRHRIFHQQYLIPKLISAASGRLNAEIRRYSADNDRINTPASELQIQLGTVKGSPLPF